MRVAVKGVGIFEGDGGGEGFEMGGIFSCLLHIDVCFAHLQSFLDFSPCALLKSNSKFLTLFHCHHNACETKYISALNLYNETTQYLTSNYFLSKFWKMPCTVTLFTQTLLSWAPLNIIISNYRKPTLVLLSCALFTGRRWHFLKS